MKKSQLKKLIKEAINSRGIEPLGYYTDQGEKTEENPEDIEYYLKQIEGMSLDDATRFLGLEGLPSSMTYKILKRHNTDVIDTFDDFSDTENPFQSSRKSVGQLNPDDLYENKIKNLSLDQKAKLYFMGMVKAGLIDTLPEDPKAAFVQQMMDSELEKLLDKEEDPRKLGEMKVTDKDGNDVTRDVIAMLKKDLEKSGYTFITKPKKEKEKEKELKEIATELGYLNESIGVNLKDLTFDMVTKVFKDEYENENPIAFPNADDSLLKVRNESDFNNWKSNTMEKFGNVQVQLKPEADVWFDKVKIMGDEFKATQDKSDTAKKSFIDSEREAGRSID